MRLFTNARAIIKHVGGPTAFAAWFGGGATRGRVHHWGRHGFPSRLYPDLSARLRKEHRIIADRAAFTFHPSASGALTPTAEAPAGSGNSVPGADQRAHAKSRKLIEDSVQVR